MLHALLCLKLTTGQCLLCIVVHVCCVPAYRVPVDGGCDALCPHPPAVSFEAVTHLLNGPVHLGAARHAHDALLEHLDVMLGAVVHVTTRRVVAERAQGLQQPSRSLGEVT